ncbi:hypothetical protein [Vibrio agarivorans]|uniref:hypothetical protein n=1 Tax=Vibrio agarivorans TaxID=153622 RepID=UPI0025B4A56E|nr:hypothetical protein [Vibrio agarivorans]MDN3663589.1 hypothetical protein [Vibrio agarivorans]
MSRFLFISTLTVSLSLQAGTAIILPGLHEESQDLDGNSMSAAEVIDWETENSDIVFGSFAERHFNEQVQAVGYMYNQKLDVNGGWLEDSLRNDALLKGVDYEDYFLHFSEDTILAEVNSTHGENTLLNRKPTIVGYTVSEDHAGFLLYQQPPWNADVFEHHQQGGALFVYHTEQFDRITFKLASTALDGSISIEYPSATDSQGRVTRWSTLEIKKDKTVGLTQSGTVTWQLPLDWVRATTHDGSGSSYGGGQYFGSTYVRDGGLSYVLRIRWHNTNSSDPRPILNEVKLKNSFPTVKPEQAPAVTSDGKTIQRWRKVRGFDKSADLNNDNYLSWNEYKNRSNRNATARFRWESRVVPFGKMWNQNSSWALTHLANPDYLQAMHSYYQSEWQQVGLNGAYNDDTNKLLGSNQFYVFSGGHVQELDSIVGSSEADQIYQQQFAGFLKSLSELAPDALISVNVGTANLQGRNGQNHLSDAASLYLREHYLFPSTGFSGYAGLAKFWDNSALAAKGKRVIFQASTRYGRVQYFGTSKENWQADQYSSLAAYYLNHHPQRSYFNQWNNGYQYGSDNTTESNYWKVGVAKNIAYQPTHLLNIDLGEPANFVPQGYTPIPMMMSTSTPAPADYTIVGDASMQNLTHHDLPNGAISVTPTHTYFLYQSERAVVNGGPEEMVLAREYTKGRVLYRTDFFGKNSEYYSAAPITIQLDTAMRVVDATGAMSDYVNEVTLQGYEGLFLLY